MTATLDRDAAGGPTAAGPPPEELPALWRAGVLTVAAAFVALELAVSARYGFHRDELYFLACARHLSWGYVDQPPLVPAVAWLATHVLGTSPTSLRTLPALAGGSTVVLAALMARELGGRRRAQVLAALATATSPQVLAACHLLSTTAFDLFFWAAISFVVLRLLRTGDQRLWPAVGILAGVGLMNKINVVFLLAGVVVAFLISGRRGWLRSPWLWAAGGLAVVLWLPDIVWSAQHDWAAVSMLHSLHRENSSLGASIEFVPSQLLVVGPVLVVFWLAGLRRLLRSPFAKPLGTAYLVLLVLYTVTGAKPYYLAGMYFVLFGAGGVWAEARLERRTSPRGLRRWVALMLGGLLVALPLALPVLPEGTLATSSWEGNINKDLSATVGWPAFVRQIAGIADALPPHQRADPVVFTGDYGAAGAIDLYGPQFHLPRAISGDNTYWWWGPAGAHDGATTIAVDLSRSYLLTIFSRVSPAGSVRTPNGVWSEERGDPIWICTGQEESWAGAWPSARHYG
ncbi:MAG TPA: glycosyltransferase family 39 protein [Acidimicrobiales bacterium]|nr:glycosyltransferase family 39 protein [Acidimicrobiales bacterium]